MVGGQHMFKLDEYSMLSIFFNDLHLIYNLVFNHAVVLNILSYLRPIIYSLHEII